MALQPKVQSGTFYLRSLQKAPQFLLNVPGLGLVEVRHVTAEIRKSLPTWPGAPCSAGMLYIEDKETEDWTLLTVGDTAVSRLYPNYWEVGEQTVVDMFSETTIEWR